MEHGIEMTTEDYEPVRTRDRTAFVFDPAYDDGYETVEAGDLFKVYEIDGERQRTGRVTVGVVSHVERDPCRACVSVRWSVSTDRTSSSSTRLAAIVLCECDHTRTLHDADGRCTLCDCRKLKEKRS